MPRSPLSRCGRSCVASRRSTMCRTSARSDRKPGSRVTAFAFSTASRLPTTSSCQASRRGDALLAFAPETRARMTVAPHGVDPDFRAFGASLDRARYGIPPGPFILSVGTIRERKDPLTLIEAFRKLVTVGGAPPRSASGDVWRPAHVRRHPARPHCAKPASRIGSYCRATLLERIFPISIARPRCSWCPPGSRGSACRRSRRWPAGRRRWSVSDAALVELAGEAAAPVPNRRLGGPGAGAAPLAPGRRRAQATLGACAGPGEGLFPGNRRRPRTLGSTSK
jgi:hypothetical protein